MAATKTFLAQVTANYLVGLALAQARGTKYRDEVAREFELLSEMPTERAADLIAAMAPDEAADILREIARQVEREYPEAKVRVDVRKQYRNMREVLDRFPQVVENARALKQRDQDHQAEQQVGQPLDTDRPRRSVPACGCGS